MARLRARSGRIFSSGVLKSRLPSGIIVKESGEVSISLKFAEIEEGVSMLISTKGRYALRILIDMAEHDNGDYMPLRDVARRQDISEKYLESVAKLLVRGGILTGLRGKGGGYRFQRSPDQISVGEILRLCEGTLSPVSCLGPEALPCERAPYCATLPLWRGLDRVIADYLDSRTLADLTRSHDKGNDYVI